MQEMQMMWEKAIQQHQHGYDSDEEVDSELGTWEHQLRRMEMDKTRGVWGAAMQAPCWLCSCAEASRGRCLRLCSKHGSHSVACPWFPSLLGGGDSSLFLWGVMLHKPPENPRQRMLLNCCFHFCILGRVGWAADPDGQREAFHWRLPSTRRAGKIHGDIQGSEGKIAEILYCFRLVLQQRGWDLRHT